MKLFTALVIGLALTAVTGCKTIETKTVPEISKVEIEILISDPSLNSRALEIDNGAAVFATSQGKYGVALKEIPRKENAVDPVWMATYVDSINYDTITPHFRALATNGDALFLLGIGSPALLFKVKGKDQVNLVYKEDNESVFYDSMAFWNANEGIAIGDPTDDCMSIIVTRDGGNNWTKISCDKLPEAAEGEAAFAASNSNIALVGDNTWVATGGKKSNILFSPDRGHTWQLFETPIIQGIETTGMYALDFYDTKQGFAIGGDYTKPEQNQANKIKTEDGGKTWRVVGAGAKPGYRSCVQYVPEGGGKCLVAIGFKGIDYSNDGGIHWKHLSDEGFYTIRFLNSNEAIAAGNGRIAKLTFK